ncbi:uncharacterized protein LOC9636809 [Selaginella moellendorffii]|nr:uncharacterized protein LOC9636809 [Selaginella moellendorffii]|eukprot:XP_002972802.2 uncharacterized protein LOC9636809 [Selaginella moellendorffii]
MGTYKDKGEDFGDIIKGGGPRILFLMLGRNILVGVSLLLLLLLLLDHSPGDRDEGGIHFGESGPLENIIQGKRTAVCLVGEARHLELTGPSIRKYVLETLKNSSVFINMPLDSNSYKMFVLDGGGGSYNFTSANIFSPQYIWETKVSRETLTAKKSPRALQGLLQYFALNEGCETMIRQQEELQGFKYDWIVRTRLDTFWTAPIPVEYRNSTYTVPRGTRYGGYNDRLGVGDRKTSRIALQRLSALPLIHSAGYRSENSESVYKAQLKVGNVKVAEDEFSFCVLSNRSFPYPPGRHGALVASIQGKGPLNGAYCRPCRPSESSSRSREMVERMVDAWIPSEAAEVEVCDGSGGWKAGWPEVFDAVAGEEAAALRKESDGMSKAECVSRLARFKDRWSSWKGPSTTLICELMDR